MEIHLTELTEEQLNTTLSKLLGHQIKFKDYTRDSEFIMNLLKAESIDITHWPQLKGQVDDWIMASITTPCETFIQYGSSVQLAIVRVYIEKNCGQLISV